MSYKPSSNVYRWGRRIVQFQSGQLSSLIIQLEQEQFTGTMMLHADLDSEHTESKVFSFWQGALTFVGNRLPSAPEFADSIKQKLNITFMDSALKVFKSRAKNPDSVREMLDYINRFGLLKWEALEAVMEQEIVLSLESLLACSGQLKLDRAVSFDLSYGNDCHGFRWEAIQQKLVRRQQQWQMLIPLTPKSVVSRGTGTGVIRQDTLLHLETWVDGQRSLCHIATQAGLDPLELANLYSKLLQQGWIVLPTTADKIPEKAEKISENFQRDTIIHRPIVLSVDDSPIVQVSIQRAIGDRYEVLCAKSAVEALNLLNSREVELLLLDVTMPDIDGLELCRTIRNISKFKDIPVIMLTAKDGLIDKVKGQFAGSTHYMAKPVDREKLLPVLEKYISVKEAAA